MEYEQRLADCNENMVFRRAEPTNNTVRVIPLSDCCSDTTAATVASSYTELLRAAIEDWKAKYNEEDWQRQMSAIYSALSAPPVPMMPFNKKEAEPDSEFVDLIFNEGDSNEV